MRVVVMSIHPLWDNRIYRHIQTLLKNECEVTYLNASKYDADMSEYQDKGKFRLIHSMQAEGYNKKGFLLLKVLLWFALHTIKEKNVKIFHIHDLLLLPLVPIVKLKKAKIIFDIHEYYDEQELHGKRKNLVTFLSKKYIYNWIDGFVCVSEDMVNDIVQEKPFEVIPNYQAREYYDSVKLIENDNKIRIVYYGNLKKVRCVDLMLYISEYVLFNNKNVIVNIGGVISEDSNYIYSDIDRLTKLFKGRFRYFGIVPYYDVASATKRADIGLYFINYQGFQVSPNKIYEYLICGLAIIGSKGTGFDSTIEKTRAGLLFDLNKNDYESIAKSTLAVINDRKRIAEMKKNSYELGRTFNWESVEKRYYELYKRVLHC